MASLSYSFRQFSAVCVAAFACACSSDEPAENAGAGGDAGSSGSNNTGGSNGGTSNGGTSNGGTSNGGTSNGGASNGGASNGGASNGGASNGGASNGGRSSTGGRPSSGGSTSSGGTSGGGAGASNGGSPAAGGSAPGDGGTCVRATLLWSDDFETGDYQRWSSNSYGDDWGNGCQSNGFSTEQAVSATHSHKSTITCSYTAMGNVHRGYGGIQFSGDTPLPAHTNQGAGIDAPFGVVNTYWSYLQTNTVFQNGTWFSFWTINDACDWSSDVLTLGLEDPSNQLAAAHYQANGGGTRTYLNAPLGFPLGRWVRTTIYVNYYDDVMHVWQDGVEQSHVTFDRTRNTICHWHWGAYASGDNDNVTLYEDDNSIWKLGEAWTDLGVEPHLGKSVAVCP